MKISLPRLALVGTFALGLTFTGSAFAQDNSDSSDRPSPPPTDGGGPPPHDGSPGGHDGMLSFLSADDRAKLMKAHDEVLANNPELKDEQEALDKQREDMKDASPEDRKAFFEKFMAHEKKMRVAMLQLDPSLQSIFDQIDQHMKDRFHQHGGPPPPPPKDN